MTNEQDDVIELVEVLDVEVTDPSDSDLLNDEPAVVPTPVSASEKPVSKGIKKGKATKAKAEVSVVTPPQPAMKKSATYLHIESKLRKYVDSMQPKVSHSENEGVTIQTEFFRTIITILKQEGSEFNALFTLLLSIVNENRNTVFSEDYAFRYFNQLKISNLERKQFERILNLLLVLCNPAIRAFALKQVDLNATMNTFKNPQMHQRVLAYFTGF